MVTGPCIWGCGRAGCPMSVCWGQSSRDTRLGMLGQHAMSRWAMCQGGRAGQALHRWRGRDEPGTAQLVQGTGWAGCCSAMAQGGVGQVPCLPIWQGRPTYCWSRQLGSTLRPIVQAHQATMTGLCVQGFQVPIAGP